MVISRRAVAVAGLAAVALLLAPTLAGVALVAVTWLGLLCLDALVAVHPRHLELQRSPLPPVRLTESLTTQLQLRNPTRRTLDLQVRDAWPPSAGAVNNRLSVRLAGGRGRRLAITLTPERRGVHCADRVTLRSFGPLGLAGRQHSVRVAGCVKVLPEFASRRHLPSRLARLRELDGNALVLHGGQGSEFDSLRQYTPGDDVRAIDWRASARSRQTMVRTFRPERDRQVLLVVDSGRSAAYRIGDTTRLEQHIEAALLLTTLAERAGDQVGLLAVDTEVRVRVAPSRGQRVLHEVAAGLAGLTPQLLEADYARLTDEVLQTLSQRSLVVILTGIEAHLTMGLLDMVQALSTRHVVVVAGAGDPQEVTLRATRRDVAEVYTAAAAEMAEIGRQDTRVRLQRRAASVVEAPSAQLAPRLADHYLELKAKGRL